MHGYDGPLDENDLPIEWRNDELDYEQLVKETAPQWSAFENWCKANDLRPIRASTSTVLSYLRQLSPINRQDAYMAISFKHESLYWHTGACPHCELHIGYGMHIDNEGNITFERDP